MSETKKGHRDEVVPGTEDPGFARGEGEDANERGRLHLHGLDEKEAPPTTPAEPEE